MMQVLIIVIVSLALIVALLVMINRAKSSALADAKKTAAYYAGVNKDLTANIATLQEAQRVQKDRTEKIADGSDADRVANSIGVLSDISKAGAERAAGSH
jgi:basic membrane lipoprotein Med (substrate-binding protein (PBP1-ABC) superfamily)